jgi:sugar transferase EpsL
MIPPRTANRAVKRLLDLFLAGFALLALSPVLLFTAIAIRFSMGSPVLFRQVRPGYRERPFRLVKFRTMRHGVGPDGRPLPDGQRLTRLGRLLRSTSLDELPQLWNVVRGDLSLVGPRPLLTEYLPYFTERERLRFTVPPGITGWAQVNGRNESSWDQRFANDVWYVEHWSLRLDLKILLLTVRNIFQRKGVVVDARSRMLNLDEERVGRAVPEVRSEVPTQVAAKAEGDE